MRKIAWTILISALMMLPNGAFAEGKLDAALGTISTLTETPVAKVADTPKEIGTSASEVLPGNGSRAGYVLGHNNILPNSEWVYIGAKLGKRNVDYSIDYSSGSIYFTEPVRSMDSVKVDYRYSASSQSARSITGPGVMPLSFGNTMKLNMTYSYRTSAANQMISGPDILTYGFNATTKLGVASSISNMMYIAAPQVSNRMSLTANSAANASAPKVEKDHFMVQNADLGMGKFRLKLGYQDVGEKFAGFQSLRDSNAAPAEVLNQLEKEKGIKRMGMSGEMPVGTNNGTFNFLMDRISDKNDDIFKQMFGFNSNSFAFSYSTRQVGKDFTRFNDLKEADRMQMANEVGMNRNDMALQIKTGMAADKKPVWSGLSISELKDANGGSLSDKSVDINIGSVQIEADNRTMSPGFTRMGALNDADRTRIASIARRAFNPKSQISEVTAADKALIPNETGLNRSTFLIGFPIGGPVQAFISHLGIDAEKGDVMRNALTLQGKWFSLEMDHRNIDPTFDRLASLQPIEKANFGNEYGMTRSDLHGNFKFKGMEADLKNAYVTDEKGASIMRRSLYFNNKLITFNANFQNIDSEFNRILDLSDADRQLMVQDKGFMRNEYAINLRPIKNLTIDSYMFDSTNNTIDQTRKQNRHKISYTTNFGSTLNLFQDSYSYISDQGILSNYFHREFKIDQKLNYFGGLQFNSRSDLNVSQEADGSPITATISENHFASNQDLKTSFKADMLNMDFGNGRYANTNAISVKTKAINRLSLITSYSTTAREDNKSETNGGFGLEWILRKGDNNTGLKMTMGMTNRAGGPKGSQQAQQFSLNGLLARKLLIFDNIKVGSAVNSTMLTGRQTVCDNALRIEAGVLGGSIVFDNSDKLNQKNGFYYTSRLLQYDSDAGKETKKWYHLAYSKQSFIAPSGLPAQKRNLNLRMNFSAKTSVAVKSYFGKDERTGEVLPVGGTNIALNHTLRNGVNLIADYTTDINELTHRQARIVGFGFSGKLNEGATYEFYYGLSRLLEDGITSNENVFRAKFDHKIDAEHFITFSAEKKSQVDKSNINPFEGDTVARIDYRTSFH